MTIPVQSGKINISSWAFGLGSFCFLVIFVLSFFSWVVFICHVVVLCGVFEVWCLLCWN